MAGKKRKKRRIRPLALCVFRRGDMIFVARGHDSLKGETFYRPIGGRIEFGERGREAVMREVHEEIEAEARDLRYLGALENIFRYEGEPGHEIALIYSGSFGDARLNDDAATAQGRHGDQILYQARWMRLDDFRGPAAPPLYPSGLLDLLDSG